VSTTEKTKPPFDWGVPLFMGASALFVVLAFAVSA
jgi:hypothetical protein